MTHSHNKEFFVKKVNSVEVEEIESTETRMIYITKLVDKAIK